MIPVVDYPPEISARPPPPWSPRAPPWCRAQWTWRWSSWTSCRSCCSPPSRPRSCTQSAPYWRNKLNLFWSCYGVAKIKFPLFSFSLITLERSQCAVLRFSESVNIHPFWNIEIKINSLHVSNFPKRQVKDLMRFIDLFWMVPHIFNESKGGRSWKSSSIVQDTVTKAFNL